MFPFHMGLQIEYNMENIVDFWDVAHMFLIDVFKLKTNEKGLC